MKYRQPGYRDADFKEKRQRDHTEEREAREEQRKVRHGIERSANAVLRCADCGQQTAGEIRVEFDTLCANCGSALHNCRNCRYLDTQARFPCRQPIPARLPSKTAANECTFYEARKVLDATGKRSRSQGPAANPRDAFDALFDK